MPLILLFHGSPQIKICNTKSRRTIVKSSCNDSSKKPSSYKPISVEGAVVQKKCLRCGMRYEEKDNSLSACTFHGHATGERGLFALAPPHQGIDGEWSDKSGVIVYRWNAKGSRPNSGRSNWKKRWSCCQENDENAPPCMRGRHVSYDDGYTLY